MFLSGSVHMRNNTQEGSAQHPEATWSQAAWRVSLTPSIYRLRMKYVSGSP